MNTYSEAALDVLRALFFECYGLDGFEKARDFLSGVIETNLQESLWCFLKAKNYGRIRRIKRFYEDERQ